MHIYVYDVVYIGIYIIFSGMYMYTEYLGMDRLHEDL